MADDTDEKYRAPALDKGLDILELLAASPTGLTQAEISKGLGRRANEIYRMLETLRRRRYVTRTSEGDRYMLSLRMLLLANQHPPRRRLLDIAEPLMRKFTTLAEQSVHMAAAEMAQIIIITSFSAPGNWRLSIRPGAVIGLYNTGSGIVLTAFGDARTRETLIKEHQLVAGEKLIGTDAFNATLEDVRRRGYSDLPSQTVVGAINLSVPVLDPDGHALAALTCPFLKRIDLYNAPDMKEVTTILQDTASEIAAQVHGS